MKSKIALLAGCLALSSGVASAAAVRMRASTTNPGVAMVYLDAQELNGSFDTVIFDALPTPGTQWLNVNTGQGGGAPRPPDQPLTYRNRYLDHDPADPDIPGGLGWTVLGVINTVDRIAFTGGPIGQKITTPPPTSAAPGLFLANLLPPNPGSGTVHVTLVDAGAVRFDATIPLVPEPHAACLAATTLLGVAALRRRVV